MTLGLVEGIDEEEEDVEVEGREDSRANDKEEELEADFAEGINSTALESDAVADIFDAKQPAFYRAGPGLQLWQFAYQWACDQISVEGQEFLDCLSCQCLARCQRERFELNLVGL
jgi:hypothetical protein